MYGAISAGVGVRARLADYLLIRPFLPPHVARSLSPAGGVPGAALASRESNVACRDSFDAERGAPHPGITADIS
jgi:hypothetical protein